MKFKQPFKDKDSIQIKNICYSSDFAKRDLRYAWDWMTQSPPAKKVTLPTQLCLGLNCRSQDDHTI